MMPKILYLVIANMLVASTLSIAQDVRDYYPISKGNLWVFESGNDTNTIWTTQVLRDSIVLDSGDTLVYAITRENAQFIEVANYKRNQVELRDTIGLHTSILYPIFLNKGEEYFDTLDQSVNIRKIRCVRDGMDLVYGKARHVKGFYVRYVNTLTNVEQDGMYYYLASGVGLYRIVSEPLLEEMSVRVCIINGDTIGDRKVLPISEVPQDTQFVAVYPNPASQALRVGCSSVAIKAATLYSIIGDRVYTAREYEYSGVNDLVIDLSKCVNGIYCLHVETTGGVIERLVTVSR